MKYAFVLLVSFSMLSLLGCKKEYQGDSYDFSNSTLPYTELKTKTFTVQRGNSINVTARVRTAFSVPTTVNYRLGGVLTGTGSIIIPANTLEGTATITIPLATVPGNATLTLTTAQNANTQVRVGYLTAAGEVATIQVTL